MTNRKTALARALALALAESHLTEVQPRDVRQWNDERVVAWLEQRIGLVYDRGEWDAKNKEK